MSKDADRHLSLLGKPLSYESLSTAVAAYLFIWDMSCPSCAIRIYKKLSGLDGVLTVRIFLKHGIAAVFYDPEYISLNDLMMAVAASNDSHHRYRPELISQMSVAQVRRLMNTEWPNKAVPKK